MCRMMGSPKRWGGSAQTNQQIEECRLCLPASQDSIRLPCSRIILRSCCLFAWAGRVMPPHGIRDHREQRGLHTLSLPHRVTRQTSPRLAVFARPRGVGEHGRRVCEVRRLADRLVSIQFRAMSKAGCVAIYWTDPLGDNFWRIPPARSGFEHSRNPFQHRTMVFRWTVHEAALEFRQKRFVLLPLHFGKQ